MPTTPHRDFIRQLRVLLVFIKFNILIWILMERQPTPNPWVMPWILQRHEKGCYSNLLADLVHTDIPGYQYFVKMPPAFFYFIEECIHHHIKKSVTNFKKPVEVGLKPAITLRHLATGKTDTSLQYGWSSWLATPASTNSYPRSAEPSLLSSRTNICSDSPDECKLWRKSSEPDGMSHMLNLPQTGSILP